MIKAAAIRPVSVTQFTVASNALGASSVGLWGGAMQSPVGSSYADYLGDAVGQELELAGKLEPKSRLAIGGTLIKNDIAGGMLTNSGSIEARFTVTNGGSLIYEGVMRAQLVWDLPFMNANAFQRAQQQYPLVVQQLLARLFADPQFLAALR